MTVHDRTRLIGQLHLIAGSHYKILMSLARFSKIFPCGACNRFDVFHSPRGNPSIRFSREVSEHQECPATCGPDQFHWDAKPGHNFVRLVRHLFPGNSTPLRIDKKIVPDPRFATLQFKHRTACGHTSTPALTLHPCLTFMPNISSVEAAPHVFGPTHRLPYYSQ